MDFGTGASCSDYDCGSGATIGELYRRSGNFRAKKLLYDKFSCKKFRRNDPLPH